MYNATLYFKQQLDIAVTESMVTDDPAKIAEAICKIKYLKLAIFALERLEEQDANK